MILVIDGHDFHYEMENLCRIFRPMEQIRVVLDAAETEAEPLLAYTGLKKGSDGQAVVTVRLKSEEEVLEDSRELEPAQASEKREIQRVMAVLLWQLFAKLSGIHPRWGILTGVRPVKLFGRIAEEEGEEAAAEYFEKKLLVSHQKTELARLTSRNEGKILALSAPESFSLYLSVPFCPTRCSYCSFVSSSVEKTFRLIPEYVRLLCAEIRSTAEIAARLHLRLDSIYMGGGTPTVLSAVQLRQVLQTVRECFDLSACREITVEAGRPDTVTPERLAALKECGTTRISINPQTLSDEVLGAIGRRHTTAQTLEAFHLAREMDFHNINMDLITGLPGDSEEGFRRSLDGVTGLSPESVTIHTLALKRAARLSQQTGPVSASPEETARMLDYVDERLPALGYEPYYLYRQSRMVGNLENVGWAKPGFESCYNVFIMEECQSILACGAGAVTKLKDPYSDRIQRIFNFKYPYEYIGKYDEMMRRKDQVIEFYAGNSKRQLFDV